MTKNIYNPMSKEFQDECKKLGLTGRQLAAKYQKEGKSIEKDEVYKSGRQYTKEQLLWYLIQFYKKYGRAPTMADFTHNSDYPSYQTYRNCFGSWSNALKLVGLDVESMVKKGIIETIEQKRRFGEMIIRDHFENNPADLAGENQNSPCDGICPGGKTYDVKSSGLDWTGRYYSFSTKNKYKEEIEIYYLLGFNKDYTKLNYGWRVPGELVASSMFKVGLSNSREFNVENMEEYNITEELREVLNKYEFFK